MKAFVAKFPRHLLARIDDLVARGRFPNRSAFLRTAAELFLIHGAGAPGLRGMSAARPRRRIRELSKDPRFRGRCVALYDGNPIDVDDDEDKLFRRVLKREEDPFYIVHIPGKRP